jgi:predicted adenylyl cyclase CyaB
MIEIEVKIQIKDPEEIRTKLIKLKAEIDRERHHEVNTLYDYSSGKLIKKIQAIRLRSINKKKHFLTFKGTPHKSRQFKIRDEFETEVRNLKDTKKILASLELKPSFQYEKFRTVYRFKRLKICLDETSVGNYLELEGRQHEIVRFAKLLGFLRKDFIKKNYIQLIEESKDTPNSSTED